MITSNASGRRLAAAALILAALGTCSPFAAKAPQEDAGRALNGPSESDLIRFVSAPNAPTIAARTEGEAADVASGAVVSAVASDVYADRRGARFVETAALPYLRASPEGAAFLASAFPRALARGEPEAACPAAAASGSPAPRTSRSDAARAALDACLATLARRGAPPSCGCRLLAADDVLLAPREAFAYAPAVSALLIGPGPGDATRLVAEALRPADGVERISLRSPAGAVGQLTIEGESADLTLFAEPDARFTGRREAFGYRRGRLAERVALTDGSGREATLLIGVERRDVASE